MKEEELGEGKAECLKRKKNMNKSELEANQKSQESPSGENMAKH